jgi:microcin C transport system substrate-binding protein
MTRIDTPQPRHRRPPLRIGRALPACALLVAATWWPLSLAAAGPPVGSSPSTAPAAAALRGTAAAAPAPAPAEAATAASAGAMRPPTGTTAPAAAAGASGAAAPAGAHASTDAWRHGLSHFGDLRYPADYPHFDFVEPQAPKGGRVAIATLGMWDSFNPFITRGAPVAGVAMSGAGNLLFDRLLERSIDEPTAAYGRLAEAVRVSADYSVVEFRLRRSARWHDGTPITADDVLFTFDAFRQHGAPNVRMLYRDVVEATAPDPHTLRFVVAPGGARTASTALDLGNLFALPRQWFAAGGAAVDRAWTAPPPGSGPYRVARFVPGRSIDYARVDDYWGADLPVNRGRHNFDVVRYDYFRDVHTLREALKAGEVDFWQEYNALAWDTEYGVPQVARGELLMVQIPLADGSGLGAIPFVFNMRKPRFADVRVREALALARDFDWENRVVHRGVYARASSFFSRSDLEAEGLPGADELALLEPFRAQVPARVFDTPPGQPASSGMGRDRARLHRADRLLREAGWVLRDGRRVHAQTGEPFTIEFLFRNESPLRIGQLSADTLRRLGIDARTRIIEGSQFIARVRQRDFDAMVLPLAQPLIPGPELRERYGSASADVGDSTNYAGVRDPVVDALIERVIAATSATELRAAGRALDRVLFWNFYAAPGFTTTGVRAVHWDRFGKPQRVGPYASGFPETWWFDAARAARIGAATAAGGS